MTLKKGSRVYLAGPMRGIAEFNFPAFHEAAADLRARGLEVWSPAEADEELDGFDPATDEPRSFVHYMRRDLPAVMDSDALVALPGWQSSTGARLEVHVADECGIPVLRYPDLEPARAPASQAFHRTLQRLGKTHDVKNADYGSNSDSLANIRACEQLGIPAWVGCEIRIGDKNARVASLLQKGKLLNESLEDSILDRAVYSVIQLVLLDEATSAG